jgi:ribA/ribD-fused uncharacterized protein
MTTAAAPTRITSFDGPHQFLSNFSPLPGAVWLWDRPYATAEHAYQAAKTANPDEYRWVRDAPSPREAKRRGRQVTMRPDWEQVKRRVMLEVILAKFTHPELRDQLIATGTAQLVEGNTWGDDYWGAVPDAPTVQYQLWIAADATYLAGRNWLGRILMTVRELLAPEPS